MSKKQAKKQTIYLPGELADRLERVKDKLNISQECAAALEIAVSRIEKDEAFQANKAEVIDLAQDPMVIDQVRRTGKVAMPADKIAEMQTYSPARRDGTIQGWNAGTATIWGMLSASDRPPLPLEYNGK